MTEAARLVDELTTLLYEVIKRWQLPDGRVCEIVRCGACRRKADRAESVVHGSDCPVYRLIRAEEANTAVIRANAEEIADLEDRRDELEAQVNALTALLAERDAEIARLVEALEEYADRGNWWQARHVSGDPLDSFGDLPRMVWSWDDMREPWTMARAALAARGGEV